MALSLDSLGVHTIRHTSVSQHLVVVWQAAIVCQGVPELADHEGGLSCPHVVPHVAAVEAPHKVQPVHGTFMSCFLTSGACRSVEENAWWRHGMCTSRGIVTGASVRQYWENSEACMDAAGSTWGCPNGRPCEPEHRNSHTLGPGVTMTLLAHIVCILQLVQEALIIQSALTSSPRSPHGF